MSAAFCERHVPPGRLLPVWEMKAPSSRSHRRSDGPLICVEPEGFPGVSFSRRLETLRGRRCSMPAPAGEKLGSLCARMCAERF